MLGMIAGSVGLLVLAACSGGTTKGSGAPPPSSTVSEAASTASSGSSAADPTPVVRQIGKTGWYGNSDVVLYKGFEGEFAVTVDRATLTPDSYGGAELELALTYQNLTDDSAKPADGYFVVGGKVVEGEFDSPEIPGQGKNAGTATATLSGSDASGDTSSVSAPTDPNALLDSVVLTYGEAGDNQTKIPLATAAAVDSVQPRQLKLSGKLVQGGKIITEVKSGRLFPSYATGEKGKVVLELRLRISCTSKCTGSTAIGKSDFSVKAPDGSSVVADGRSPFCCDNTDDATPPIDKPTTAVDFVVPAPGAGRYVFTLKSGWYPTDPAATLPITV